MGVGGGQTSTTIEDHDNETMERGRPLAQTPTIERGFCNDGEEPRVLHDRLHRLRCLLCARALVIMRLVSRRIAKNSRPRSASFLSAAFSRDLLSSHDPLVGGGLFSRPIINLPKCRLTAVAVLVHGSSTDRLIVSLTLRRKELFLRRIHECCSDLMTFQ